MNGDRASIKGLINWNFQIVYSVKGEEQDKAQIDDVQEELTSSSS